MALPLINKTYLRSIFEVSIETDVRIETRIEEAQIKDIKAVLGDALYWDFVNNITLAKYVLLLNGGTYTNKENNAVEFAGVKKALAYYAYARIIESDIQVTRYGAVQKKTDFSEPIPTTVIARASAQNISMAVVYMNEVASFLDKTKADYPLWQNCNTENVVNNTSYSKISTITLKKHRLKY